MINPRKLEPLLPAFVRRRLQPWLDTLAVVGEMHDPRVLRSLLPSAVRGLLLHRGKQGVPTRMGSHHPVCFSWSYPDDQPELAALYQRAQHGQWRGEDLPWSTPVDPLSPHAPLLPADFLAWGELERSGVQLKPPEQQRLLADMAAWMLSQFLHGEQGALYASAQVTESIPLFNGKLYGATQVMDEGRHVEVFHRYLDEKLQKLYQVNDNLFVILDSLVGDSRWDMKFLGMQIMVEGLALGSFSMLYRYSREPLLRALLERVIQDEGRHVHYGVVSLREHVRHELAERERREREDWAFEVALLMRNRFLADEVYDEWFAGSSLTREQWRQFIIASPGLEAFRHSMFSRLVPNLREIGLMSPRVLPRYESAGLMRYFAGASADRLSAEQLLAGPELPASPQEPLG